MTVDRKNGKDARRRRQKGKMIRTQMTKKKARRKSCAGLSRKGV